MWFSSFPFPFFSFGNGKSVSPDSVSLSHTPPLIRAATSHIPQALGQVPGPCQPRLSQSSGHSQAARLLGPPLRARKLCLTTWGRKKRSHRHFPKPQESALRPPQGLRYPVPRETSPGFASRRLGREDGTKRDGTVETFWVSLLPYDKAARR